MAWNIRNITWSSPANKLNDVFSKCINIFSTDRKEKKSREKCVKNVCLSIWPKSFVIGSAFCFEKGRNARKNDTQHFFFFVASLSTSSYDVSVFRNADNCEQCTAGIEETARNNLLESDDDHCFCHHLFYGYSQCVCAPALRLKKCFMFFFFIFWYISLFLSFRNAASGRSFSIDQQTNDSLPLNEYIFKCCEFLSGLSQTTLSVPIECSASSDN